MMHNVAERYDVLSPIGTGGTAVVYKALDKVLNRFVAIKMLRTEHAHDTDFLQRFRKEAQSVAAMQHPHIVAVHDVGEHKGRPYIVMEYVDGETLHDRIERSGALPIAEAVVIARRVAEALVYAHERGIIHRDIKPHNILLGTQGAIKVTDFGIARDVSSVTITQVGALMGSVHYFSPEHARGYAVGKPADVYSLGVVLYQMITGKLPFQGESPVGVALMHLQHPLIPPRTLVRTIPQSVENIVMRALRKSIDERYASISDMLADLHVCLLPSRMEETPLSWTEDDDMVTRQVPALAIPQTWEEPKKQRRRKGWVIVVLALFVATAGVWAGWSALSGTPSTVLVPIVRGLPMERAIAELQQAGLVVSMPVTMDFSRKVPENYVISQTLAGEQAKRATPIELTVSKGIQRISVPDFVGKSEEEVITQLDALGVATARIDWVREYDGAPKGQIVRQFPEARTMIDPIEESLRLVVSRGKEAVRMPDLVGRTRAEAEAILEREGFVVQENTFVEEEAYAPIGQVVKQSPYAAGDEVRLDAAGLVVTVSKGLPADAKTVRYTVVVGPAQPDAPSDIVITLTDAYGEAVQKVKETITKKRTFGFDFTVSPTIAAVIGVQRDGVALATYTWTLADVHVQPKPSDDASNEAVFPVDAPQQELLPDAPVVPEPMPESPPEAAPNDALQPEGVQ